MPCTLPELGRLDRKVLVSTVQYPTGTLNPHDRPSMKNYKRKPIKVVNHHHFRQSHNKFYAHKIRIDGYLFDSHAEGAFYLFAKNHNKIFSMQTKFYYRYNDKYKSRLNGKILKLSNRSYRPDFVIYKPSVIRNYKSLLRAHGVLGVKTIKNKQHPIINQIAQVIDVKGKHYMTAMASQRMDDFTDYYHIPVIIVRLDRNDYSLKYYIKGYRTDTRSISLLK